MNYKRLFIDNSLIFITIITNNRKPILIENIDLLNNAFMNVQAIYNFELIAYVVQPDHIHCIIKPQATFDYPKIIKSFKYSFTKNIRLTNSINEKIWQNRYWEHTIRDEEDLHKHLDYIHYNSVKHNITKSPKLWKYSSFEKFVEMGVYEPDWCNFEDKYKINGINLE